MPKFTPHEPLLAYFFCCPIWIYFTLLASVSLSLLSFLLIPSYFPLFSLLPSHIFSPKWHRLILFPPGQEGGIFSKHIPLRPWEIVIVDPPTPRGKLKRYLKIRYRFSRIRRKVESWIQTWIRVSVLWSRSVHGIVIIILWDNHSWIFLNPVSW